MIKEAKLKYFGVTLDKIGKGDKGDWYYVTGLSSKIYGKIEKRHLKYPCIFLHHLCAGSKPVNVTYDYISPYCRDCTEKPSEAVIDNVKRLYPMTKILAILRGIVNYE